MQRRDWLMGALALAAAPVARADTARDSLLVLAEAAPNARDPHGEGVNAAAHGVFTNVYDRLINFDRVALAPGLFRYDYTRFKGELAEHFEVSADGRSLLFQLRPDALFHDGTPVTAADVKFSLDRGVSLPASRRQLATGSLTDPAQFVVLDPHRLRIDLPRPDRYTLPNLALSFASVLNAALLRQHATDADPWAVDWMRRNTAGGGAYRIDTWTDGEQVAYARFEDWRSGARPSLRRAVLQVAPLASARMAAVQKGDADIALQLAPRDVAALAASAAVRLVSIPVTNTFRFVAFNTRMKPFDDGRVRQAIAYALPYEDLFQGAMFGRGSKLFGAASDTPAQAGFPQPYPYRTDPDRARALLKAAGLADGFATSFAYSQADATIAEPVALLVQEALGRVGITVSIDKVAGAQWGTRLTQKTIPFYLESSAAWFDDPDYVFRIFFQGSWRWNFGAYDNPALNALVEAARWETDRAKYDDLIRQAIAIAFRDVPIMPLWRPSFEAAMQPDIANFTYYIHGQVDFRPLTRA